METHGKTRKNMKRAVLGGVVNARAVSLST